jgi:hypothetical protein
VAVKSFPAEPIRALIADQEGSYLIGGGSNGNMFLWEVRALCFLCDGLELLVCVVGCLVCCRLRLMWNVSSVFAWLLLISTFSELKVV